MNPDHVNRRVWLMTVALAVTVLLGLVLYIGFRDDLTPLVDTATTVSDTGIRP